MQKKLWSPEEDEALKRFVEKHGCAKWSRVARLAGLQHRCPKSCRLRWVNYLRPGLTHGPFSAQEIRLLLGLHSQLGNKWSQIAAYMPGRSDNDVKNAWHLCSRRKKRSLFKKQQGGLLLIPPTSIPSKIGTSQDAHGRMIRCTSASAQGMPSQRSLMSMIKPWQEPEQAPEGLHQVVWNFIKRSSF